MALGLKSILGKGKRGQMRAKWFLDTKTMILAPPISSELTKSGKKVIIFGTNNGKVYALDREGNVVWIFDAKENVSETELLFYDMDTANSIQSTPVVYDLTGDGNKEVIFGSEMGIVYALNHEGKPVWKYKCQGSVRGGIVVKDIDGDGKPEIVFGSGDGNLYILNSMGETKQKHEIGCAIESTAEIINDKIVFGCNDGTIFCINYSGKEEWTFKTEGKVLAKPTVGKIMGDEKEYIVIGSTDHYIYTFETEGELVWKYRTGGAIYSKVTLADINDDHKLEILFGSCDNSIYALKSNGDKIWSYETEFWVVAPVIVDDIDGDGKLEIIAGSYDHNIYVLDAEGNYVLDYVPGLSGITQQSGSYSDIVTSEPGDITGKKLWQYQADGVIVGCAYIHESKNLIFNTRPGKVNNLEKS